MPRRTVLAVAAACALLGAIAIYVTAFSESAEDRVRKTLEELSKAVAVKEGDSLLPRAARVRSRLKDLVDDDVRTHIEELGLDIRGRHQLEDSATKTGLLFQSAECIFSKVTIKLDPPQTFATVDGVAVVTAVRGGERRIDERLVHFLLRKDGSTWRVTTIGVAPPQE